MSSIGMIQGLLGKPKVAGPVPGSERQARNAAANTKPVALPKKRKLKKFAVKGFNYEIEKSR